MKSGRVVVTAALLFLVVDLMRSWDVIEDLIGFTTVTWTGIVVASAAYVGVAYLLTFFKLSDFDAPQPVWKYFAAGLFLAIVGWNVANYVGGAVFDAGLGLDRGQLPVVPTVPTWVTDGLLQGAILFVTAKFYGVRG